MFQMFKQLFLAMTSFFLIFEKTASAGNHLADWANETAQAFADEARIERQKKLAKLKQELKSVESKAP